MATPIKRYQKKITGKIRLIRYLLQDSPSMSYVDGMVCGDDLIANAPRISRDDLIAKHLREIKRYRGYLPLHAFWNSTKAGKA